MSAPSPPARTDLRFKVNEPPSHSCRQDLKKKKVHFPTHALFSKQKPAKEQNVKLAQKYILLQKTNEKDVRLGVQIRQEIIYVFFITRLEVEPESLR